MRRVIVDPRRPLVAALEEAAQVIRGGGVVAMPTDTLYGLAVDPFRVDAVAQVFAVKGRSAERALPLVAADVEQVIEWIGPLPALARRLAAQFWPGPLTLIVHAPAALASGVTGGTGTVGVRVPAHEVARALCRACGMPLTATSANVSGASPSSSPDDVERTLGDRIDLLIDAGLTLGGPPSTIVDVTAFLPRCVRAGAIAWEEIDACVRSA